MSGILPVPHTIAFEINLIPKARQEPAGCIIGGHASFYKKKSQRDYEEQLMIELERYRPDKPMSGAIFFRLEVFTTNTGSKASMVEGSSPQGDNSTYLQT